MGWKKKNFNKKQYAEETKKAIAELKERVAKVTPETIANAMWIKKGIVKGFHSYSLYNILLAMTQNMGKVEISQLAPFSKWKALGRFVSGKGVGLKILSPMTKINWDGLKKATTLSMSKEELDALKKEYTYSIFKAVTVYDIQNTEGDELPANGTLRVFGKDTINYADLYAKLRASLKAKNITVEEKPDVLARGGWTDGEKLVVNSNANVESKIPVLLHELGHYLMHFGKDRQDLTSELKETEAHSFAFVMMKSIGLDTNAELYVKSWSRGKALGMRMETLISAVDKADKIIGELGNV